MKQRIAFLVFAGLTAGPWIIQAQLYSDEVQVINGLGGKVGIGTTSPLSKLTINGDVLISNASIPMGLMTEVGGTTPLLNLSVNFREPNKNTGYIGAAFRIDSRPGLPLFQWLVRNANSTLESQLMVMLNDGYVGIGTTTPSQKLSVNGNASKATAGDWLANSDARLKTNISPLHSEETLQKMLRLQGITYEWNDDKTGLDRPVGIHYGFTAQNIQEVFPTLVVEDDIGYLQSSYSTYDAMLVESMRALNEKIERLEKENEMLQFENKSLSNSNEELTKTDEVLKASIEAMDARLQQIISLFPSDLETKKLSDF